MLVRRNTPFPQIAHLRRRFDGVFAPDLGRLFDTPDAPAAIPGWTPALDVIEQEDQILLRAELPGLAEEDVEITVEDGKLTLRGEKKLQHDVSEGHYRRIESRSGSFRRVFDLPTAVDQEGIDAQFSNGVLVISLPKAEQAKPKKIAVTVN